MYYRQAHGTASGIGISTGISTGTSPRLSIGTGLPGTGMPIPVSASHPFPTGNGSSSHVSTGTSVSVSPPRSSGPGISIHVSPSPHTSTGTSIPAPIVSSPLVPITSTPPFPTSSSIVPNPSVLPILTTFPDAVIAYQDAGCNTNGTGPAFAWFNFPPGECQVLFPNPSYNFASLWVEWTGPQYDCCTVQIYVDSNCQTAGVGYAKVYTPYGSCVDAGGLPGKSFKLNCYNEPIPKK